MTVDTTERFKTYVATGNPATQYAVPFEYYKLDVYAAGILKTDGVDYIQIDGSGNGGTGTIQFILGHEPTAGLPIAIVGSQTISQPVPYEDFDDAPSTVYERTVDQLTMMAKELDEKVSRAVRTTPFSPQLPALDFDNSPNSVVYVTPAGDLVLAPVTNFSGSQAAAITAGQAAIDAAAAAAQAELAAEQATISQTMERQDPAAGNSDIKTCWIELDAIQPGIITRETVGGTPSFTDTYWEEKLNALYALGYRRFIILTITDNGRTYTTWQNTPISPSGVAYHSWYNDVAPGIQPNVTNFDVLERTYEILDGLDGAVLVVGIGRHDDYELLNDIYKVNVLLQADPLRFGKTLTTRINEEITRYTNEGTELKNRFNLHRSWGGYYIAHESDHLASSAILYNPIANNLRGFGDLHIAVATPIDFADTDPIADVINGYGVTWLWFQTSAGHGYNWATGKSAYVSAISVFGSAAHAQTWQQLQERAYGRAGGASTPKIGVVVEGWRVAVQGVGTLTFGAVSGNGVTVTLGTSDSIKAADIGKDINVNAGQTSGIARIISVTGNPVTSVTVNITENLQSVNVAAGFWALVPDLTDINVDIFPAPVNEVAIELTTMVGFVNDISFYAEPYYDPGNLSLRMKQSQAGKTDWRDRAFAGWTNLTKTLDQVRKADRYYAWNNRSLTEPTNDGIVFFDVSGGAGGEGKFGFLTPGQGILINGTTITAPAGYEYPVNLAFAASVAGNALTVAIKGADGNDPSPTNPVLIPFRSSTLANGTPTWLTITAPTSFVVSNGSTLGTLANVAFRYWIVGFDDGGTFRLGLVNVRNSRSIMPLRSDQRYSSTAEGGAGAADNTQTIYTGVAVTNKAMRILGFLEYSAGLGTAGVYASTPTKLQLMGPDVTLPGQPVQVQLALSASSTTGTTLTPVDNTIPQITEGTEFQTQTITPTFEGNVIYIEHDGQYAYSAITFVAVALHQDAVANAQAAVAFSADVVNHVEPVRIHYSMVPNAAAQITWRVRAGGNAAGTVTFNGQAGAGLFGGVHTSTLKVTELMA